MVLPMFAMVILIVFIFIYGLQLRVMAVKKGQVHPGYFKVFDPRNQQIPERILQHKNHADNLFQVPVLFYAACIVAMLSEPTDTMVFLAWGFVLLRVVHSFIHLTYNNVVHRLVAFVVSNILLMVLWVQVVISSTSS